MRVAAFALVLAIAGGASHRYGLVETIPFLWTLGIVGGLAFVALALCVSAFLSLWQVGARGGRRIVLALVLLLPVLAMFGNSAWRMATNPFVNDVSTDVVEPPFYRLVQGARGAYLNPLPDGYATELRDRHRASSGRRYEATTARVLEAVVLLVRQRGWTLAGIRGTPLEDVEITVEALSPSWLLRLPAVAAIRLIDEGETTFVDMRSASGLGRHDLGDNAIRITRFLLDLDLAMQEAPLPLPVQDGE